MGAVWQAPLALLLTQAVLGLQAVQCRLVQYTGMCQLLVLVWCDATSRNGQLRLRHFLLVDHTLRGSSVVFKHLVRNAY